MNIRDAYNDWASQYDVNENKTRDLEAISLRQILGNMHIGTCLEIGCGTGKNTGWLVSKADEVLAVDFSEEMLDIARNKIVTEKVKFQQFDINQPWNFTTQKFDLVVFSLVLEHISDLVTVFKLVAEHLKPGGYLYVGELHPFKQYTGSKAKYETPDGIQHLTCFTHNLSDFTHAAAKTGFEIALVDEFFDDNDRSSIPRILALLFRKND